MEFHRTMNRDANLKARAFFEEAIALDPEYLSAYPLLANTYLRELLLGPGTDKKKIWGTSMELANKAMSIDESYFGIYTTHSLLFSMARRYDEAIAAAEHAISLDPNNPELYSIHGFALMYAARWDEAIELFEKVLRLDPFPSAFTHLWAGAAYRGAGRYDEAIQACNASVEQQEDFFFGYVCLASVYSLAGRDEEARAAAAEVLRINPGFSVKTLAASLPYKDQEFMAKMAGALRKAGLPE